MKYSRLTKEQFEALGEEFALFLSSNSIDIKQWDKIKTNSAESVEHILDMFSDLVWDDILDKVKFIENISSTHLFLFKCHKNSIDSIVVKSSDPKINLNSSQGQLWLSNNLHSSKIELLESTKKFDSERNNEIYSLISRGSHISEGQLFIMCNERLSKSNEK